jgi:hypothetical protein
VEQRRLPGSLKERRRQVPWRAPLPGFASAESSTAHETPSPSLLEEDRAPPRALCRRWREARCDGRWRRRGREGDRRHTGTGEARHRQGRVGGRVAAQAVARVSGDSNLFTRAEIYAREPLE